MAQTVNLNTLSDADLKKAIRALPAKTAYSGREYLLKLFNDLGRTQFSNFVARVNDMPEELDLDLHFTREERKIFERVLVQFWDRRKFLHTFGWGLAGGVAMGIGATGIGEQLESAATGRPLLKEREDASLFVRAGEALHKIPGPETEFLIGAALVQEGYDKWNEIKLEEIADAVELLVGKLGSNPAFMREISSKDKGIKGL